MTTEQLTALVQAGGVLGFAAIVWWELRDHGKQLRRIAAVMVSHLERERMRNGTGTGPIRLPTNPGDAEVHE